MKISDYIFKALVQSGITEAFAMSGKSVMPLLKSLKNCPGINSFHSKHPYACARAADGYTRATGKPTVCVVTAGPGAMYALSGIMSAWHDSLPLIILSGGNSSNNTADTSECNSRHGKAVEMAKSVTKHTATIHDPHRVRLELEKALHLATSGRPGPVWLELPLNIQETEVEPKQLIGWQPAADAGQDFELETQVDEIVSALQNAERPLIIAGNGIHLSHSGEAFLGLIERFQLPVITTHLAKDLLPEDHPLNLGVFKTAGCHAVNFATRSADLVISLGAGTPAGKDFAPKTRKLVVDVDPAQIRKADISIIADLQQLLPALLDRGISIAYRPSLRWLQACTMWKRRYSTATETSGNTFNATAFLAQLADALPSNEIVVFGDCFPAQNAARAFKVKKGQRILLPGNWNEPGADLPRSLGACRTGKPVTLITDATSIQSHAGELQTVRRKQLPLRVFVLNDRENSSEACFGNLDIQQLGKLYDLNVRTVSEHNPLTDILSDSILSDSFANSGPILVEVSVASPESSFARLLPSEEQAWNLGLFESNSQVDLTKWLTTEENELLNTVATAV